MGLVQQAVLEFDEEVQAPWRPRLVAVADPDEATAGESVTARRPHPSGRSSSRVGVCRPAEPLQRRPAGRGGPARVPNTVPGRPAEARQSPVAASSPRQVVGRRLRLTRRARLLATVLTLALGVAIGSWLGPLLAGGGGDLRLAGVQSVVVQPGDTLWSIAGGAAGTADIRAVVDKIQELNGLHGTVLMPGQVLRLP
jgi:nucleoid-associated protein YgaU